MRLIFNNELHGLHEGPPGGNNKCASGAIRVIRVIRG